MKTPLRVLMVEDSEDDMLLLQRELRRGGITVDLQRVETLSALQNALAVGGPWDVVLSDYYLQGFSGLEVLRAVKQADADLPFIMVSGKLGDETAVEVMKAGADDYILKDRLSRLVPAIGREQQAAAVRYERRLGAREILVYQDKLRSLAAELTFAEERQKRHIATELHDGIVQTLSVLSLKLELLRLSDDPDALSESLESLQTEVGHIIADVRSLMEQLSPAALYELGLEASLRTLAEVQRERFGVQVEIQCDGDLLDLGDDLRLVLFQAVRELLRNVSKHGETDRAWVVASRQGDDISIAVKDQGVGFDPSEHLLRPHRTGGFGLFSIQERLRYLGGTLSVQSAPGEGACFTLTVPVGSPRQQSPSEAPAQAEAEAEAGAEAGAEPGAEA
jgi:signal transduction histidine kinase